MYAFKTSNTIKKEFSYLDFIQRHASIGIWEFDTQTLSLEWSSETKKIHEVPLDYEPSVESGILFYKSGYSRDTITQLFNDCLEKHEEFDEELQIVTATGKEKWIRAIGTPVLENNVCVKVQGLFQDIDKKTKNSITLAQKETQLRKSFENALVGMAILDLDGSWIHVNKSLCRILGYSKEELKSLTFLDITHPDDVEVGKDALKDMVHGNIDSYEAEKRYLSKEGDVIWAKLSSSIIKDDNGNPLHFVAQIHDLSDIKRSNKKVIQLLETTENQNKRLLNFAHIVSHNLRSHYSNLGMLLDLFKMDIPDATNNEIFPLVEEAVRQLGETVVNLNEVAAINIERNLKVEPINLLEKYNSVSGSISALVLESKTKICVDIDKDLYVKGIPAYLDSIILNFLTNAIKYKKADESAKIELKTQVKDDFIILAIKDYGLGIDLKKHGNKLFGMYKTFHNHKDSRGLGLFITKNQVEALGGKIEVESKVNEGTTFYIHLMKDEKN